jgi:transcriptional regulator with XRE-family HTH domain
VPRRSGVRQGQGGAVPATYPGPVPLPADDLTLAAYLRAIRGRLVPESLGLPGGGVRRVPGLRREEVAVLGGLSVDYYTRLEQGREVSPGAAVLEGIADGLELEGDERDHLFALAGLVAPPRLPRVATSATPALGQLLDSWSTHPAFVIDPAHDVLAANALARAVYAPFERFDNLARMSFLDPAARHFHTDWARAADSTVASLRAASAEFGGDPGLLRLVADLNDASPDFAERWSVQRVQRKTTTGKRFEHDDVGRLDFDAHTFAVQGSPGLQLVVYGCEAGSVTERALVLLSVGAADTSRISQ